jgi:hypothetical protein
MHSITYPSSTADHTTTVEKLPGVPGVNDPAVVLRIAGAIEERGDWTRTIQGCSIGMWFAVAVRPGACGSLLSGLASMYFPDTRVFGEPGREFAAAAQEALIPG